MRTSLIWIALGLAAGTLTTAPCYAADVAADDGYTDDGNGKKGDGDGDDKLRFAVAFSGTRWIPSSELPLEAEAVTIASDGTVNLTVVPDDVVVPLFGIRYWVNDLVGLDLAMGFNVESGNVDRVSPNPDPNLTQRSDIPSPATIAFAGRIGLPLSVYSTDTYRFLLMPEIDIGYASKTLSSYALSTDGAALDLRLSGFVFGVGGRVGAEMNFNFIDVPNLSIQTAWGARFESRRRNGRIGDAQVTQSDTGFGTSWYGDGFDIFLGSFAINYYL